MMIELVSEWMEVPQSKVSAFADLTEDWQFIHVDPELAQRTPFGGTIAHGFLLLSLFTRFSETALPPWDHPDYHVVMSMNYGFDRVRFLKPVPTGARVRARFEHPKLREKESGKVVLSYTVLVQIEGRDQPALVADWLFILFLAPRIERADATA
jgi:acyl dehydratase